MTIKETIKEIEKKITEQENVLQELKRELEKVKENENKIPDDVKYIPLTISADEYSKEKDWRVIWIVDSCLNVAKRHINEDTINAGDNIREIRRIAFPTEEYAKMYREKCQLIADMLHFKWLYDRDYNPDWFDGDEDKYFIYYDHKCQLYDWGVNNYYEQGITYFSTKEIADKCAEWLNYIYKKGEYAEG